jgi:hypothetical protein
MEEMIPLLRSRRVAMVGSLHCYLKENVTAQRGEGVYEKSIAAIRLLNGAGFGVEGGGADSGIQSRRCIAPSVIAGAGKGLPGGAKKPFRPFLQPLIVLANMPLGRFQRRLEAEGGTGCLPHDPPGGLQSGYDAAPHVPPPDKCRLGRDSL